MIEGGPERQQLEQAYRETTYRVRGGRDPICVRVGQPSEPLDHLLSSRAAATWAFVTADNPGSVIRPETENRAARERLATRVALAGRSHLRCDALDDHGRWPAERGLLILDISRRDALALARNFGQNAILWGRAGQAPELAFCDEAAE